MAASMGCTMPLPLQVASKAVVVSATLAPRMMAKRHRRNEHHSHGPSQHVATNKPVCPDSFTAPLSEATIEGRVSEAPKSGEKGTVKYSGEASGEEDGRGEGEPPLDKASSWMESVKGQAFWFLRSLATVID